MLVKVVLSYYMEGEHSQGASNPRVSGLGAGWDWERVETGRDLIADLRLIRMLGPSTPRKRETGQGGESCGIVSGLLPDPLVPTLPGREGRCPTGVLGEGGDFLGAGTVGRPT